MISNTWRITDMFYMPYKTINYYVCCALVYNMSGSKIFYETIITTDSIHYFESEVFKPFKAFKPFKLECMTAILCLEMVYYSSINRCN